MLIKTVHQWDLILPKQQHLGSRKTCPFVFKHKVKIFYEILDVAVSVFFCLLVLQNVIHYRKGHDFLCCCLENKAHVRIENYKFHLF